MNAYWLNELVYKSVECPSWIVWILIGLVVTFITSMIITIIWVNR